MNYGAWRRAALCVCAMAACGGNNDDESDASFGPNVGTFELTTSTSPTTTTPTTSDSTAIDPPSGGVSMSGDSSGDTTTTTTTPTTGETTTTTTDSGDSTSTSDGGDDSTSTGTTGEEVCEAPGLLLVCDDDDDPFHALGLDCDGAPENTIQIAGATFKSNVLGYKVARGFGTAVDPDEPDKLLFRPREGEKFLIISTGEIADLQPDGTLVEVLPQFNNNNNFNPDDPNSLPAPMSPLVGSNSGAGGSPAVDCDGQNDCSDSIAPNWNLGNKDPNDLLWASFDVTVPGGTHGFSFDVAYFSAEYPDFVGEKFNDMFIGWTSSEVYTGNVTFFNDQPFTVTALAPEMEGSGFTDDSPALVGTGFEGHGSTGWATVNAQASPGETLTFALAIMDMGDSNKATLAVLDNWRWSCVGCVPIELDPACGEPGHPKCCGLCVEKGDDPECGTEGHPKCCVAE